MLITVIAVLLLHTNVLNLHEHQAVQLCQFENISHHAMRVEVIGYLSVFS